MTDQEQVNYRGPIFIIGMPRSGTKLLRDVLNRHSKVAIMEIESHFIPYFIHMFGDPPDFGPGDFDSFIQAFKRTTFYLNMVRIMKRELDPAFLDHLRYPYSWNDIFTALFCFYMPPGKDQDALIGDKTPGYMNYISQLARIFPGAIFLHIIRDPRDYALSVKRSFGKSILRAADRWSKAVAKARGEGQKYDGQYFEVRYEDLLDDPEKTMMKVCSYLNIEFDPAMMHLDHPSENLGDTQGALVIVKSNKGKYRKMIPTGTLRRLEQIVFSTAQDLGFTMDLAVKAQPLNLVEQRLYLMYDGFASILFHIRTKGVVLGLEYFIKHYFKSSWRPFS
jgi:hypothetical protein